MRIDRAAVPYVAATLVPGAVLAVVGQAGAAGVCAVLAALFAWFFRDPERHVPSDAGAVLAPADGRVLVAGPSARVDAPPGVWQQVSIFLSPLNVHVNRVPVSGRLARVEYHPGQYLPAYRREAGVRNHRNELWIDSAAGAVVCRQVAGVLVRRVVCRLKQGAEVTAGDRFGIMKFGSRIDLFLPVDTVLHARPGDCVRAGETILARL